MEIEKKFRVKSLPDNLGGYPVRHIEQGYLCEEPVVRIRKSNDDYILTYKSKTESGDKPGIRVRNEIEADLTEESYDHLKQKIDHYIIEKDRYMIPLPGGRTAELDIFKGRLEGLIIVEVEFPDEETAAGFVPPGWFGEDVSLDGRFSNSYLQSLESSDLG